MRGDDRRGYRRGEEKEWRGEESRGVRRAEESRVASVAGASGYEV